MPDEDSYYLVKVIGIEGTEPLKVLDELRSLIDSESLEFLMLTYSGGEEGVWTGTIGHYAEPPAAEDDPWSKEKGEAITVKTETIKRTFSLEPEEPPAPPPDEPTPPDDEPEAHPKVLVLN